ncbi:MAG: PucR family transcriptional regulator [Mycobacterium sp.]|nr:PucR family transcriptional regulator [Mycobacterium sp.]
MATAVQAEVEFYKLTKVVTQDDLAGSCTANARFIFGALGDQQSFDTTPASSTGEDRAQRGVPLPAVMAAYRVGSHYAWNALLEIAAANADLSKSALLNATARIWEAQDVYTEAMVSAYRRRATQQAIEDEAERAALTEALLNGCTPSGQTVWEIADLLRLPARGPYVVVAAQAPVLGKQALPGIEAKLRSLDIFSAWRLLPDQQIGIAHVGSDATRRHLMALLERVSTCRVGVSPRYDDLADTTTVLRYARIALNGKSDPARVTVFDDNMLGIAAVTDPEVTRKLASNVLCSLERLPDDDREVLYRTFRSWVTHKGSLADTAAALFCHPNTVRHRLRRIEEHTGHSTTVPHDLAELCLAFEIDSKLR